MLFGKKKKKILLNYILQVLLLPAATPNPTGAGYLFYYYIYYTGRWVQIDSHIFIVTNSDKEETA